MFVVPVLYSLFIRDRQGPEQALNAALANRSSHPQDTRRDRNPILSTAMSSSSEAWACSPTQSCPARPRSHAKDGSARPTGPAGQ